MQGPPDLLSRDAPQGLRQGLPPLVATETLALPDAVRSETGADNSGVVAAVATPRVSNDQAPDGVHIFDAGQPRVQLV